MGRWSCFIIQSLLIFCEITGLKSPDLRADTQIPVDYESMTFNLTENSNMFTYHIIGSYESTARSYRAYASGFSPNRFDFFPSIKKGCTELLKTSFSSEIYHCDYATNGGFFTFEKDSLKSYCLGNLIGNGSVWQIPSDGSGFSGVNFGITKSAELIFGFLNSSTLDRIPFTNLITGKGWLVRGGINYVNMSQDLTYEPNGFTTEKAPRTTVGAFQNGTMILLQIDGEEDIHEGADLFEAADLLVELGVYMAVNLDGK